MGICDNYAGIVINQNATATSTYAWRSGGAGWIYQTFTLPTDYQRGTNANEQIIPDLAGIQILLSIDSGYAVAASLDYILQFFAHDNDSWTTLTTGTVIGSHADGPYVWYDIIFEQSIPVSVGMLNKQFRFGLQTRTASNAALVQAAPRSASGAYLIGSTGYTASLSDGTPYPITVNNQPAFLLSNHCVATYSIQQGIASVYYVTPTPLTQSATGQGMAFQSDGVTPLLGHGTTSSLNFRLLGLTADSGINFLHNEYRSAVVQAAPGNVVTTEGLLPTEGTGQNPYYLSPPQPSPFAVVSLYNDVRPVASTPSYGPMNLVGNPSFEYDSPGNAPTWWTTFNSGGTVTNLTVRNTTYPSSDPAYATWVYDGNQSLHMLFTFSATTQQTGITSPFIAINPTIGGVATPQSISFAYNLLSTTNCALYFSLLFYDSSQTLLPNPYGVQNFGPGSVGVNTLTASTTVPANAAYVQYMITGLSTGAGSIEAYVDSVQVTATSQVLPYFDGDDSNAQWTGQRGLSPSVQTIDSTATDNYVVVDGVVVDPLTPNMAMSVYYSQDDAHTSENMSETDWEQKLWTRVPRTYLLTQKQNYVFPEPVHAKYIKLEFSDLPAQSYDPGPFAKPIRYKKFPSWVANFFVTSMQIPSFIASQVEVQYDGLSFAYQYYLDDLHQLPMKPTTPSADAAQQLTGFLNQAPTGLDATTLAQIKLAMNSFQQPITSNVDTSSVLGSYVSTLPSFSAAEGGTTIPIDLSVVSTLQREPVLFEQSLPVMYFFVTSRHAYKELTASFEYNRAYICGINSISFLRNNYTIASDTPLYIETGGDQANVNFSDWSLGTDGNWYTYAG